MRSIFFALILNFRITFYFSLPFTLRFKLFFFIQNFDINPVNNPYIKIYIYTYIHIFSFQKYHPPMIRNHWNHSKWNYLKDWSLNNFLFTTRTYIFFVFHFNVIQFFDFKIETEINNQMTDLSQASKDIINIVVHTDDKFDQFDGIDR